jgi:hypothetical protein
MDATPLPRKPPEPAEATDCGPWLDPLTSTFTVNTKALAGVGLGDIVKLTVVGKVVRQDQTYENEGNARLEVELGNVTLNKTNANVFEALGDPDEDL